MSVIQDYIQTRDVSHQPQLDAMYHALKNILPKAEERLSYGMPTFYGEHFIAHFDDFKDHISLFPGPDVLSVFSEQLKSYKTSKGTVQFSYTDTLPVSLIQEMITYKIDHHLK